MAGAEPPADGSFSPAELRPLFSGPLMVNGCYGLETASAALDSGYAQMVSLGRPYISTTDVVERYRAGEALNEDQNPLTWYGGGAEGYCEL